MARRACRAIPDPVMSRGTSLVGAGPTRRFSGFGTGRCQVLIAVCERATGGDGGSQVESQQCPTLFHNSSVTMVAL